MNNEVMYSTKEVLEQIGSNRFQIYLSYKNGMFAAFYDNIESKELKTDDYTGVLRYILHKNDGCLCLSSKFKFNKKCENEFVCHRSDFTIRLTITYN